MTVRHRRVEWFVAVTFTAVVAIIGVTSGPVVWRWIAYRSFERG